MWKKTKTYVSWDMMKQRCNNNKNPNYPQYGGKGITHIDSWHTFANFLADMGERPQNTSLDRIDNTKGYSKDNCRWATRKQQQNNQGKRKQYLNNKSGLSNVYFDKHHQHWRVSIKTNLGRTSYYHGKDFFEACCVRKKLDETTKSTCK